MKRVKSKRIQAKQRRNVIVVIAIILCLFAIFGFGLWTRSEVLKTTAVKFVEYGLGTEIIADLDVHKEEIDGNTKYYVILPEKVNSYIVDSYFIGDEYYVEDDEQENIENSNTNTLNNDTNVAENTVDEKENTNSLVENIVVEKEGTNTTVEDTVVEKEETNTVVENTVVEKEETNTVVENTVVEKEETNTVVENTVTEKDNTNTIVENTVVEKENTNTVVENTVTEKHNTNILVENSVEENNTENIVEVNNDENKDENELPEKKYYAGEIVYLTEEQVVEDKLEFNVNLKTVEISGVRLYEQEILNETSNSEIVVTGYIPFDYYLNVQDVEKAEMEKLIADMEEFKDSKVLAAYDIKIVKDENEYQPSEYNQYVNVAITSKENLENNLIIDKEIEIVHVDETEEEIIFEKLIVSNKTIDTVECETNAFSRYAVLETNSFQDNQIIVNNYDNDYNHYMGLNYTENFVGREESELYTKENLAKVTVNYYGYKKDESPEDIETDVFEWGYIGNTTSGGNRIRTPNAIVTFDSSEYVDFTKPFELKFIIPYGYENRFNLTATQNHAANANYNISRENNTITISANNWGSWNRLSYKRYYLNFAMVFTGTDDVTINDTYNNTDALGMVVNGKAALPTGYISTDTDERQSLITYTHAVPINDDGSVSIELIDNPFMDRPRGRGFDGWRAIDTLQNTITKNDNNFVQTLTTRQALTTNASGVKEVTVDLYSNWAEANVIVYDAGNNNEYQSGTFEYPVGSWEQINNRLNSSDRKYASEASSREVNIILVIDGALTNINTGNGVPYTITSIYAGEDFRNNGAFVVNNNITLNKDVQLAFLKISGSTNYISSSTDWWGNVSYDTDATNAYNYTVYSNSYNFRIGRGMMPNNNADEATTFACVFAGCRNNTTYKCVVETGKYNAIQAGDNDNGGYTINSTLIIGNDIDRVKTENDSNDNSETENLKVFAKVLSSTGGGSNKPRDAKIPIYNMVVKSGSIGRDGYQAQVDEGSTDAAYCGMYVGGCNAFPYDMGDKILTIEGGLISNINGGLLRTNNNNNSNPSETFTYVKGGKIMNIVGGAGRSETVGDRCIQVTDGSVEYSVNGGSNGVYSGSNEGILSGNTIVYVGGNAVIGSIAGDADPNNFELYGTKAGSVMGAGNGNGNANTAGQVDSAKIYIDGNAIVKNSVYGGGNYGPVEGEEDEEEDVILSSFQTKNINTTDTFMIASGTNSGSYIKGSGNQYTTSAFSTTVKLENPEDWIFEKVDEDDNYYIKSVSTGNYIDIAYNYTYHNRTNYVSGINVTARPTSSTTPNAVFNITRNNNNGSYSICWSFDYVYYTRQGNNYRARNGNVKRYINANSNNLSNNNVNVYLLDHTNIEPPPPDPVDEENFKGAVEIYVLGGTINRNIYGGANQKHITGNVKIVQEAGTILGTIYGGSNARGAINGEVLISVKGGTIGTVMATNDDRIFGGGYGANTDINGNVNIRINELKNNTYIYGNIYGGSESGKVKGNTDIQIKDVYSNKTTLMGNIFGGGKGTDAAAATDGSVYITVDGGSYSNATVFGGCNIRGTISGAILVEIGEENTTSVSNVYGGGNAATVTTEANSVHVYIYNSAEISQNVYNGGNSAGIDGTAESLPRSINIDGGVVNGNVYGGSNESGTLQETFVNCYNGANIRGNVYGSAYGEQASVSGNTNVNIRNTKADGSNSGRITIIQGSVFGGGDSAIVGGDTNIDVIDAYVLGNVYGGGNQAQVSGNSNILVNNATIGNAVYGGGNQGNIGSNSTTHATATININNNSTVNTVYGGGSAANLNGYIDVNIDQSTIGTVYGGGEGSTANVSSYIELDVDNSTITNNIYGGGNAGPVAGEITVNCTNTTVGDSIFGAGKGSTAIASSDSNVTIIDSTINNCVYGGGDAGRLNGDSLIVSDNSTITNVVYGGGNAADVNGNTTVNFNNGSSTTNIFGGGNRGNVGLMTTVSIADSDVTNTVYGGGNEGTVGGATKVTVASSDIGESVFGGGKGFTATVGGTAVAFQTNSNTKKLYGGGDQGQVNGNTSVIIDNSTIDYDVFGGGNGKVSGTTEGKVSGSTNLIVRNSSVIGDGATVKEVDGTDSLDVYGELIYNGNVFGGGCGKTATVATNAAVTIDGSEVKYNVYGGGDNGDISNNSSVKLVNSQINGSAFGAGNGIPNEDHTKHIARVSGNSYITVEGTTVVEKNVFASGNAAKTGVEVTIPTGINAQGVGTALAIADIYGGTIKGNLYGGANSSVVFGTTVVNIGEAAIKEYYGAQASTTYTTGDILIEGQIFGAGESMKVGVAEYDFDERSVSNTTDINIDGEGYNGEGQKTLVFKESVFASGNASSPVQNGTITIRNLGSATSPMEFVSLQRAGEVKVDNSVLHLSGTTDSTAKFSDVFFSLNILDKLTIKNNTTLYLDNGANTVKEFASMYGDDANEVEAYVDIPTIITGVDGEEYDAKGTRATRGLNSYHVLDGVIYADNNGVPGEIVTEVDFVETDVDAITRNTDNRLYVYNGVNVNIAISEDPADTDYGPVSGMTYFGIYKIADGIDTYKGMFDEDFESGTRIEWDDRDYMRSYVQGRHDTNHVIEEDGFYTMFEQVQVELEAGESLNKDNYYSDPSNDTRSISYLNYIDPTPEEAPYYMWFAGPDSEIFYYNFTLTASKFSTLGTKLLTLDGISYPNATIKIRDVSAALEDGVSIISGNNIPNIEPDPDKANKVVGLEMKTGITGWAMNGSTEYFAEYNDSDSAKYDGDTVYIIENSGSSPAFQFFLHHSNNISQKAELGTYIINMDLAWKKALTRGTARIQIEIDLATEVYEGNYYNAAMTPGKHYDLFTSSTTNITKESSFSAFFEMSESDFYNVDEIKLSDYPNNAYRYINTSYVFPENTSITMIDRSDNSNLRYYYYVVTAQDVANGKKDFNLKDFRVMGSLDQYYDEESMMQEYYDSTTDYQYESFIFMVDFENADFGTTTPGTKLTGNETFTLILNGQKADDEGNIVPGEYEAIYAVMDEQRNDLQFAVYDTESLINITGAKLTKSTIYPGSNTTLGLTIDYTGQAVDNVAVQDTRYYDKKMGSKITLYEVLADNSRILVPGSSLFGTYFSITQKDTQGVEHVYNYYPRADGTTRIKLAEKVSNLYTDIDINTENSTLNGNYIIEIQSYGSADGVYYGIQASDREEVALKVVDNVYGLNSEIPENQTIIDMLTGYVLDPVTGYTMEDGVENNNAVNVALTYQSGLDAPFVSVQLLRRNYDTVNSLAYEKVDLQEYIQETLEQVNQENEYVALSTDVIDFKVGGQPLITQTFEFKYTMKSALMSGTYKLVYTLYDVIQEEVEVLDEAGNLIETKIETRYNFIGDTFSYLVIK